MKLLQKFVSLFSAAAMLSTAVSLGAGLRFQALKTTPRRLSRL